MNWRILTCVSALAVIAGCAQLSERFTPQPASKRNEGYGFSNSARSKPVAPQKTQARHPQEDTTTEAFPGQPRRKVTDPVPLMECRSNWCLQNCDPEVMPRPKACVHYKVPRDVDIQGNAKP